MNSAATQPRVSAICIFYNEEDFLQEAIESVLAQTYGDHELLLVDDGSDPAISRIALDYVRRFPGRVFYLEHVGHANLGMSAARNLGLAQARGEFIAFIDADDVWPANKLAEQVALLDALPDVGAVCGAVLRWRSWAGGKDKLVLTGHKRNRSSSAPETSLALYPLGVAQSPTTSAMIRRSAVEEVGGFDDRFRGMFEDQVLFAKLYLTTPFYFSTSLWLKYRLHERSCVATAKREGRYSEYREFYFRWLESYIAEHVFPGKDRVLRAIKRVRWRHEHKFLGPLLTLPRRLLRRLAQIADLRKGSPS